MRTFLVIFQLELTFLNLVIVGLLNSVVSIAEKRTARLKSWFRLQGVQVAVEGKGWMVLSIDNYDHGIF